MYKLNLGNDLYLKGRIGWKGLNKNEYLENGDYRIINATSLQDKLINWDICGYITKERYDESPEIQLEENDILISKDGTLGKIGYVKKLDKPSTVASGVFVLRNICEDKVNTDYLYHILKSSIFKDFIFKKKASGSTINHLYQRDLVQFEIDLPSLTIQEKVANLLSSLDSKIELNNKINKELEAMSKTLYDYWFVQFDFPNEHGKPYKSSGGKMVYNQELKREIPEIWNNIYLDKIIDILNGYAFKSEDYVEYGIFVLRTKNFNEENITEFLSDDVYLPNNFEEKYDNYLCQPFDYHLVMVGASVGKTGMIYSHQLPALRNQNMWCFRPKKKSSISRGYLKYLVDSLVLEFSNHATGSARQFYTKDNFKKHPIVLPSDEILKKFENLHNPIQNKQANIQKQNQELSKLRDWLLPMLMNGQVRV